MNIEDYYKYCLLKKGVTEHFPFDKDILVFKVGGKIFALTSLKQWEEGQPSVNLKCDPDESILLRTTYNTITPGYHMNKRHWNTIRLTDDVFSWGLLKQLIDHSYTLVFNSLSKKVRNAIL